jgi:ATP-dependent DNA ligase
VTRRNPNHYTGATKHVTLSEARRLGSNWVVQEKVDGMYVRVCLNSRGRVDRVFSRSGAEVGRDLLEGIRGARLGRGHAELTGELEAHTESGNAAALARGQRLVHLFDCLHDGARSLVRSPYRERRDALWRMQSEVECYGPRTTPAQPRATSGRYASSMVRDWRVAPIVPQAPLARLDALWDDVVRDRGGEGLVLVNLDAPAGAPASKLKCKPYETIDASAIHVSRTVVTCAWAGQPFNVQRGRHHVELGEVVEVRHAGWFGAGVVPRFPAIVRVRRDLQ